MKVLTIEAASEPLIGLCSEISLSLSGPADLNPLISRIGNARIVLLGEASHGTSEYYTWRTQISRRLIQEKGFNFIAVEGDWPACYEVNRHVKGYPHSAKKTLEALQAFKRWPTWMWGNHEVVKLVDFLKAHNLNLPDQKKVGFYGLDVYSLWESLDSITRYLRKKNPEAANTALRAFRCFEPFGESLVNYARMTSLVPSSCEEEVYALLAKMHEIQPRYKQDGTEAHFNVEQNALVVRNAERYYRTMIRGGPRSWNVRDQHMADTLERLMKHHGPDAKGIVWEHNTHVGDARSTNMSQSGMINVGQLLREQHELGEVFTVGFGSYRGTVISAPEWGEPMEVMELPEAREESWEYILHYVSQENKLLMLSDLNEPEILEPRGHRAVGVVYQPQNEGGNYVPTVLPGRYDAFLYFDTSTALHPLNLKPAREPDVPDTFPWKV